MTSWADRLGVFDLETTGVDVETARIVTACIAVIDATGEVVDRWDWLADPEIEIPEAASAVHGITTERARAEGRPTGLVVAEITQTLRTLFGLGIPVVVYNAPYDLSVLAAEARRHGIEPIATPSPVVDPIILDKPERHFRQPRLRLVAGCHQIGDRQAALLHGEVARDIGGLRDDRHAALAGRQPAAAMLVGPQKRAVGIVDQPIAIRPDDRHLAGCLDQSCLQGRTFGIVTFRFQKACGETDGSPSVPLP